MTWNGRRFCDRVRAATAMPPTIESATQMNSGLS